MHCITEYLRTLRYNNTIHRISVNIPFFTGKRDENTSMSMSCKRTKASTLDILQERKLLGVIDNKESYTRQFNAQFPFFAEPV